MQLNKIFHMIFIIIILLTQICSRSAFAVEKNADLILKSKLKKQHLVLTRTLFDLKSEKAKPCDKLTLQTLDDIDYENKIIIPCGSIIEGKVVKARNNLIFRADAYIDFLVTNIKTDSGCNICFENTPIKLRIVDPNYKNPIRRTLQRTPVFVGGLATAIALVAATNLNDGIILAIVTGAQMTAGFISGFIDPDIDKTRFNGGITRSVEGTALGTVLIAVEKGFEINVPACCYITIKIDDKARQKILCSMQNAIASNKNFKKNCDF